MLYSSGRPEESEGVIHGSMTNQPPQVDASQMDDVSAAIDDVHSASLKDRTGDLTMGIQPATQGTAGKPADHKGNPYGSM
jgi:hypothetical protein